MTEVVNAESVHFYNLAHTVPLTPINAHLNNKFLAHSFEHLLPQPDIALHKFCPQCNSIWIPGISLSMRILYTKKPKSAKIAPKAVRRRLQYKCLMCKHKKYDELLLQEKRKIVPVETGSKKKKKKKSTLSSMLEKKKEMNGKGEGYGLDLMEFMSKG